MSPRPGILFVDDELENVEIAAEILAETSGRPVRVATSVEEAVTVLHAETWALVVMDVFIPLGEHPQKVLGPRARKVQEHIEHLGGLVLLEEIERLKQRQAKQYKRQEVVLLEDNEHHCGANAQTPRQTKKYYH